MADSLVFHSKGEVEALTDEQAMAVLDVVRETLIDTLEAQRNHPHLLDDCGDYLFAATDNWTHLFGRYFNNDGNDFTPYVKQWLLAPLDDWGASDGEARFVLCPFTVDEWEEQG